MVDVRARRDTRAVRWYGVAMATKADNARAMLAVLALDVIGWPYIWGGESEEEGGFDCSGFVSDRLKLVAQAFPDLYDGGRRTARGLFSHFTNRSGVVMFSRQEELVPGSIIFYRRGDRPIHHVAIHLFDGGDGVGPIAIEAGGAGSSSPDVRQAMLRSASVRLTATDSHGSGVRWIGLDVCSLLEDSNA